MSLDEDFDIGYVAYSTYMRSLGRSDEFWIFLTDEDRSAWEAVEVACIDAGRNRMLNE